MKISYVAVLAAAGAVAIARDARADNVVPGAWGVSEGADANCWVNEFDGMYGIRYNNSCGGDGRMLYYPFFYQGGTGMAWYAWVRASSGVQCGLMAVPDDGGPDISSDGPRFVPGPTDPLRLHIPAVPPSATALTPTSLGYHSAFVFCYVPQDEWINSVGFRND
jgi:hypothetical protein